MKKRLRFAGVSGSVLAASLLFSVILSTAYATETVQNEKASVTLNGKPAGIYAEWIDGKLYFSIRDYWEKLLFGPDARVAWEPETQTASGSNGYVTCSLSLEKQTCHGWNGRVVPLAEPAILKDGKVLVTFSSLSDFRSLQIFGNGGIVPYYTENGIDFHTTIWERWEGDEIYHFASLVPESIPIATETGLPDWEHAKLSMLNGRFGPLAVGWERFEVTKSEAEDGVVVFHYISRENPEDFLIVTAREGYVVKMEEHNHIFPIDTCG